MDWNQRYAAGRKRTIEPTNEITYREQCGSRYGYDLHRKNSEPSCILCQEAVNDYANKRNRERGVQEFKPAACGTNGGYMKHLRENQLSCEDCLKAHKEHVAWYNLAADARQKIIDKASNQ